MREGGLDGVRVALLEARMSSELSELVRRRGGVPTCAPALREVALDCTEEVASFLSRESRMVIFLSGAGATALFREAERQDLLPALVQALTRAIVVCRGPKPSAVLKRHGIPSGPHVSEPYTTAALLETLQQIDLEGMSVTLIHYGERNAPLAEAILARGATLEELCLYEWQWPEDIEPVAKMIHGLVEGAFDALVFTSQIQCRYLFEIASTMHLDTSLAEALNTRVVVAAIGPTCRDAVEAFGVTPHVVPQPPKMGALVASLASYFSGRTTM